MRAPAIDVWVKEVKEKSPDDQLGMILIHNGIVRATSKEGRPVLGMFLSYDERLLQDTLARYKNTEGIVEIRIWINQGKLSVGDDIMIALVAGRFRTDILPVFQDFLREIKTNVVSEKEITQE